MFRQNSKGCYNLFRISDDHDYRNNHDHRDNHDHRNNHDYHSSEIAIIAFSEKSCDNHIQQEAIIVVHKKLKMPFQSTLSTDFSLIFLLVHYSFD
jgi:ABC-type nickel/cobalt efflux system permease component RcnA